MNSETLEEIHKEYHYGSKTKTFLTYSLFAMFIPVYTKIKFKHVLKHPTFHSLLKIFSTSLVRTKNRMSSPINIEAMVHSVNTDNLLPINNELFNTYGLLFVLNQVGFTFRELLENNICHQYLQENILTTDGITYFAHEFTTALNQPCQTDFVDFIYLHYF